MADCSAGDLLTGIGAFIGAWAAIFGVDVWRRELRGKAHFETARALMRSIYRVRELVSMVRSPMVMGHEFPEDYRKELPNPSLKAKGEGFAFVYQKRWELLAPALEELGVNCLEAKVVLGREVFEETEKFRRCISRLRISLEDYVQEMASPPGGAADNEYGRHVRLDVWEFNDKVNPLTIDFKASVSELERLVEVHLRG